MLDKATLKETRKGFLRDTHKAYTEACVILESAEHILAHVPKHVDCDGAERADIVEVAAGQYCSAMRLIASLCDMYESIGGCLYERDMRDYGRGLV